MASSASWSWPAGAGVGGSTSADGGAGGYAVTHQPALPAGLRPGPAASGTAAAAYVPQQQAAGMSYVQSQAYEASLPGSTQQGEYLYSSLPATAGAGSAPTAAPTAANGWSASPATVDAAAASGLALGSRGGMEQQQQAGSQALGGAGTSGPYIPVVVGPDGQAYIHVSTLQALGGSAPGAGGGGGGVGGAGAGGGGGAAGGFAGSEGAAPGAPYPGGTSGTPYGQYSSSFAESSQQRERQPPTPAGFSHSTERVGHWSQPRAFYTLESLDNSGAFAPTSETQPRFATAYGPTASLQQQQRQQQHQQQQQQPQPRGPPMYPPVLPMFDPPTAMTAARGSGGMGMGGYVRGYQPAPLGYQQGFGGGRFPGGLGARPGGDPGRGAPFGKPGSVPFGKPGPKKPPKKLVKCKLCDLQLPEDQMKQHKAGKRHLKAVEDQQKKKTGDGGGVSKEGKEGEEGKGQVQNDLVKVGREAGKGGEGTKSGEATKVGDQQTAAAVGQQGGNKGSAAIAPTALAPDGKPAANTAAAAGKAIAAGASVKNTTVAGAKRKAPPEVAGGQKQQQQQQKQLLAQLPSKLPKMTEPADGPYPTTCPVCPGAQLESAAMRKSHVEGKRHSAAVLRLVKQGGSAAVAAAASPAAAGSLAAAAGKAGSPAGRGTAAAATNLSPAAKLAAATAGRLAAKAGPAAAGPAVANGMAAAARESFWKNLAKVKQALAGEVGSVVAAGPKEGAGEHVIASWGPPFVAGICAVCGPTSKLTTPSNYENHMRGKKHAMAVEMKNNPKEEKAQEKEKEEDKGKKKEKEKAQEKAVGGSQGQGSGTKEANLVKEKKDEAEGKASVKNAAAVDAEVVKGGEGKSKTAAGAASSAAAAGAAAPAAANGKESGTSENALDDHGDAGQKGDNGKKQAAAAAVPKGGDGAASATVVKLDAEDDDEVVEVQGPSVKALGGLANPAVAGAAAAAPAAASVYVAVAPSSSASTGAADAQ